METSKLTNSILATFGTPGSLLSSVTVSDFGNVSSPGASSSTPVIVLKEKSVRPAPGNYVMGNLITLVALYFALKCKTRTGGVDILQLLIACCCSPCYILYRLARPCT